MSAAQVSQAERINLNRIDLNLLSVLATLLEQRSVSRAAAELQVTQPAVSNALARLRDLIGDPLLIKTKKGMEPTERALELLVPVRDALAKIHMAVENARPFDPATSSVEVSIAADEYCSHLFIPAIAQCLTEQVPGLTLHLRRASSDAETAFRDSAAHHFILSAPRREYSHHHCVRLIREGWKVVARPGHPRIHGKLTAAQYADLPSVVPWYPGEQRTSWVDEALAAQGLVRRAATRIATSSPVVCARGDHVMVLPTSLALSYARVHGLVVHDLPLDGPAFETAIYWQKAYDAAPMHRWVREHVLRVCRDIAGAHARVLPLSRAA